VTGEDELVAPIEAFRPTGDVLELACGRGAWTEQLLHNATSVTGVDAAPEMLARAKARVGAYRVRFIQSDLFAWTPDRVFFMDDGDLRALLLGAGHAWRVGH
jgi:demethylmenaquinone methyltransferase/2-methoxy-6-polyprenyl-1,4-benzoquinol methylase